MGHYEEQWLKTGEAINVLYFKRYVDDIFCLLPSEEHVESFFSFINNQHPNISFTLEKEINNKLPFLDVLLDHNSLNSFSTSTFF